jgi:glycosyltransferase involved in cell wall biosynthesis
MKVSIITAVRNGADAIERTLRSINEQQYADIEQVIIDGASTDRTVELARRVAARNPRFLSERDRGVYDAFNKGLQLSSGDVVGYLNCGDTFTSAHVVNRLVAELTAKSVDAVYGDVMIVDPHDAAKRARHYRSARFHPSRIGFGFMPAHPTLYMRKSVYDRFGGYDASYRIAGDFELVARVFGRENIAYSFIDEVLVRMPRGGLSTRGVRSNLLITREMKRACEANRIRTSLLQLALRFPIKWTEYFGARS